MLRPTLFGIVPWLVIGGANILAQDSFTLSGSTSKMIGIDYQVMPHVEFNVLRNSPVFPRPLESDDDGIIQDVPVPAGTPVSVLFFGPNDYLPVLQSLSGEVGKRHEVHVTLLTIEQAVEQGMDVDQYFMSLLYHLAARGIGEGKPLWNRLNELRAKARARF